MTTHQRKVLQEML
jgi:hypothetical protein